MTYAVLQKVKKKMTYAALQKSKQTQMTYIWCPTKSKQMQMTYAVLQKVNKCSKLQVPLIVFKNF